MLKFNPPSSSLTLPCPFSVGAFVIGVGVHMITKGTQVNAGVEHAMHEEKEAAKKVIASQYVP